MKFSVAFAGAGLASLVAAGPVLSEEFRLTAASSHPPALPWVGVIANFVVPESNKRLEAMGSENRIEWTEAYAGALFGPDAALESVEKGLADLAWIGTIFEPSKMPLHNVHLYAPFAVSDVHDLTEIGDRLEAEIPAVGEEWTRHNQKFLGTMADGAYHVIAKKPIQSLNDLKGMKLMTAGAVANWLEGTGAVAVPGGYPDFYNSISTGVADGAVMTVNGMLPLRIHEVAPYITLVDMGGPITGALSMNADTWDALPEDVQSVLADLGKEYSTMVADEISGREAAFLEKMGADGATISKLAPEERVKWAEALPDLAGDWVARNEADGLPAGEVLRAFMSFAREAGATPVHDWSQKH